MSESKITTWKADPQVLEIGVWIEPWGKVAKYYREFTSIYSSPHPSRWVWFDGAKDSERSRMVNDELMGILDKLVQDHEMLGLFCKKYGIGEL